VYTESLLTTLSAENCAGVIFDFARRSDVALKYNASHLYSALIVPVAVVVGLNLLSASAPTYRQFLIFA